MDSYLVHYNTLLQNTRDIITKCDSVFLKIRQFYFKMRLQNATFITKCVSTVSYITFGPQKMHFALAWFKCFLLLNSVNVRSKISGCEFSKYFACYLLVTRFAENEITKEQNNDFFLIDKERGINLLTMT